MIIAEIFIRIAIRILLRYFDFTKKKKEKKERRKNPSKEYFELQPISTSSNGSIHSQPFRNFPNRHRINIKTRVCLIFESKQAYVSIFSKRKSTPFLSHTHTHMHYERMHTKSYPLSRSVVFSPSLVLFRPVIAIYRRKPLPFCFSNSEPRGFLSRFIARLSRCRIVRRIDPYICPPVQMLREGRRIFTWREPNSRLWNYFLFFRLLTRLLLLFSSVIRIIDHLESCWKYSKRR